MTDRVTCDAWIDGARQAPAGSRYLDSIDPSSGETCSRVALLLVTVFAVAGCTAHFPVNEPVSDFRANGPYMLRDGQMGGEHDELVLVLTFSGGGTRAAAFSYGVLETLADTPVSVRGRQMRLLDEADVISSVSGGSFTAAYYGLFGDRVFEDFEQKFLKKDVQGMLTGRLLSPTSWPNLASSHYGRSELAADLYDELLFENRTFRGIAERHGPMILIQATDITLGMQFPFAALQFSMLCANLLDFPVSRAVTASSAVPGVFSSVVINNYAGTCGLEPPPWVWEALAERDMTSRRYAAAVRMVSYLDREERPHIHLFDGGISDNLGVRGFMDRIYFRGGLVPALMTSGVEVAGVNKIAFVIVNAQTAIERDWDKSDESMSTFDALSLTSSASLNQYNFETLALMREQLDQWEQQLVYFRCHEVPKHEFARRSGSTQACTDVETYLVELSFDGVRSDDERILLKGLPTSFYLADEEVDRVRAAARRLLQESSEFQRLVSDLRSGDAE